jgi:hypothetical protein
MLEGDSFAFIYLVFCVTVIGFNLFVAVAQLQKTHLPVLTQAKDSDGKLPPLTRLPTHKHR